MFKSLSRAVTCTRELVSIYMCYSQGDGLNTPLSRLSYLVLYTVLQLSICLCTLSLYGTKYPMYGTLMMDDIRSINYVYLYISSPYVKPNINSTPAPEC